MAAPSRAAPRPPPPGRTGESLRPEDAAPPRERAEARGAGALKDPNPPCSAHAAEPPVPSDRPSAGRPPPLMVATAAVVPARSRWNRGGCSRRSSSPTRSTTATTSAPRPDRSGRRWSPRTWPRPARTPSPSRSPRRPRPNLDIPVTGFDPDTQTWTITPDGPLPTITTPVDIDGFTEANTGLPYNYPNQLTLGGAPTEITSSPNTSQAINGNNARVRVIIDGSNSGGGTGFVLDASHSMLRGLIIDGLRRGRRGPQRRPTSATRSRGISSASTCCIRSTPNAGTPLPSPSDEVIVSAGQYAAGRHHRRGQHDAGRVASAQDDVVIAGNGAEGVWIEPSRPGNPGAGLPDRRDRAVGLRRLLVARQRRPGGARPVVERPDRRRRRGQRHLGQRRRRRRARRRARPRSRSPAITSASPPGGVYKFGNRHPRQRRGRRRHHRRREQHRGRQLLRRGQRDLLQCRADGVAISGATATGNIVSYNLIGVTSDGSQALGNDRRRRGHHLAATIRSGRATSSRPTRSASTSRARRPRGSPSSAT